MSKYLFVLARGPQEPEAVGQCLRLARLAVMKKHEVCLFLLGDAVSLPGHYAPAGCWGASPRSTDDPGRLFSDLRASGARILLDKRSARKRLGARGALHGDLALGSEAAMIDLAEQSKVFSF